MQLTEDLLVKHLNSFLHVNGIPRLPLDVIVATDPITAMPKGYAYLDFDDEEAADLAMQLHGEPFWDSAAGTLRCFKEKVEERERPPSREKNPKAKAKDRASEE